MGRLQYHSWHLKRRHTRDESFGEKAYRQQDECCTYERISRFEIGKKSLHG